jgi:hypothetical protein
MLLQRAYAGAPAPEVFLEPFYFDGTGSGVRRPAPVWGLAHGPPRAPAWTSREPRGRARPGSRPARIRPFRARGKRAAAPQGDFCGSADMGSGKLAMPPDPSNGIPVRGAWYIPFGVTGGPSRACVLALALGARAGKEGGGGPRSPSPPNPPPPGSPALGERPPYTLGRPPARAAPALHPNPQTNVTPSPRHPQIVVLVILVPSLAVSVGLVLLSVALMRYLRYLKRSHDAIHLTVGFRG